MKLFNWFIFYIKFAILAPTQNDARSTLLSDIRDEPSLRLAINNSENPPPSCARDDLFKHIREGIQLKPTNVKRNEEPTQNNRARNGDLAAALFDVIEKRRFAIQNSEDENEDKDGWSDY